MNTLFGRRLSSMKPWAILCMPCLPNYPCFPATTNFKLRVRGGRSLRNSLELAKTCLHSLPTVHQIFIRKISLLMHWKSAFIQSPLCFTMHWSYFSKYRCNILRANLRLRDHPGFVQTMNKTKNLRGGTQKAVLAIYMEATRKANCEQEWGILQY